ncbi:MAG: AbrB/MazE/SpoVT family DNA-binding domain-containing protein [Desulfurococcales archaeon]|nr:AbrB/MazE/SpoVT family DNA-binding domain-containing protein [Desulfurococcales archaeon]
MSVVVVDDRGRIIIPSRLRNKLQLKKGDTFIILELRDNILVLKRIDVEKLAREIAEEVAKHGIDLDKLGQEVEEEANKLGKEKIHD